MSCGKSEKKVRKKLVRDNYKRSFKVSGTNILKKDFLRLYSV